MGEDQFKRVKIFVASGTDLKVERERVIFVLNKLNNSCMHLDLKSVEWEIDITAGSYNKERAQDEFNQYLKACDIILVMFYSKAGKFTIEEYNLALDSKKKVFLYFKTGFSPKNKAEIQTFEQLIDFKEKVEKEDAVLYRSFNNIDGFEKTLYEDLNLYLSQTFPKEKAVFPGNQTLSSELTPGVQPPHTHTHTQNQLLTSLPPRKIKLIGRDSDLKDMESKLKTTQLVLLVNGLGGVGKTEVCKKFFYKHYNEYCYSAWVDWYGSIKQSLVHALGGDSSGFISVEETDTVEQRFEKIQIRLRKLNESMLLVLDNIENPETDPDIGFLRRLPAWIKMLASSRHHIEGMEERSLEFLKEEECLKLFYQHFKGQPDDESVKQVIEKCASHTLTVELLARTANHEGWAVNKLLETLRTKGFNLNTGKVGINWHDETEKRNFFQHLEKVFDIVNVTQAEQSILVNMSLLPHIDIMQEWVREWLKLETSDDLVSLVDKGWLKRDSEFKIYMHPVTGEVVRAKLKPNAEMCRVLVNSLSDILFCEPTDNPIHKKEYLIFGESVVHWLGDEMDVDMGTLVNNLCCRHKDLGQIDWALEFQLKANQIYETVLEENHSLRATSYNNLSQIYQDMGHPDRALEFQLKALKIKEKTLGENHPSLATSYNNISLIYKDMDQPDQALEFQLKALKIRESVLGENHPDTATSYSNLSGIYWEQGQLDRALEFQLKALNIRKSVLGENHPDLAISYNNVSGLYWQQGELDRALEFQLNALKIRESVLGENHPDSAQSFHNISKIYKNKNDYPTAETFAEKAVAIMAKLFPGGHPSLDTMRRNLEIIRAGKG